MSQVFSPNPFQSDMVVALEDIARAGGATCDSTFVHGNSVGYYVLALASAGQAPLKVYVYLDEVGYFAGETWYVHERRDFATPEELKQSALIAIRSRLGMRR